MTIETRIVPGLRLPIVMAVIDTDGAAGVILLIPEGLDPRTVDHIEWITRQVTDE